VQNQQAKKFNMIIHYQLNKINQRLTIQAVVIYAVVLLAHFLKFYFFMRCDEVPHQKSHPVLNPMKYNDNSKGY
jgi:uncharacterized membrane protein YqhA